MIIKRCNLFLEKFSLDVEIGIHGFEIGVRQRLFVTVNMEIALDISTLEHDKIVNTVNYDFLRKEIKQLTDKKRFNTQEALCYEILKIALGPEGVLNATVMTQKPDVYSDADSVGCEMYGQKMKALK